MSVHMVFLIPLGHLSANQSKIALVFFASARFPYPTSGWANFNGGDVISKQLISFGVTQELLPSLQHPSALPPWGDCCPQTFMGLTPLLCSAKLLNPCQGQILPPLGFQSLFSPVPTPFRGNKYIVRRGEWRITPSSCFYWYIWM